MKAISSRKLVSDVLDEAISSNAARLPILTKDGVNGWGAHCPSCWAQRFECDVGTTCGLCNNLKMVLIA